MKRLEKKTCNYCYECNRNYPLNIQYCEKCGTKMFPVPYEVIDNKK